MKETQIWEWLATIIAKGTYPVVIKRSGKDWKVERWSRNQWNSTTKTTLHTGHTSQPKFFELTKLHDSYQIIFFFYDDFLYNVLLNYKL